MKRNGFHASPALGRARLIDVRKSFDVDDSQICFTQSFRTDGLLRPLALQQQTGPQLKAAECACAAMMHVSYSIRYVKRRELPIVVPSTA